MGSADSIVLFTILLFLSAPLLGAVPAYPEIQDLNREDPLFRQAVSDIDEYYHMSRTEGKIPPLSLFSYRPKEKETLFGIAARCNIPYESIALLNSLSHPSDVLEAELILIPNQPGLFVPLEPETEIEKLVYSWRSSSFEEERRVVVRGETGERRSYIFLRGERFHSVERAFFLQVLFRFPLPEGVVTSGYGMRRSPISKRIHFHHGIDIAASSGTEVYASWNGSIEAIGYNDILGNYIVISHSNNFRSIYGHLEKIFVKRGTSVGTGTIIGSVGNTGLSTGPHLHFEIRKSGESWDPSEMIPVRDR